MQEKHIDHYLSPQRSDHNAKQDWNKHENNEQVRLSMKRLIVKTTKPHKIRLTPGTPP